MDSTTKLPTLSPTSNNPTNTILNTASEKEKENHEKELYKIQNKPSFKKKTMKKKDIGESTHQLQEWIRQKLTKVPQPEVPRLIDAVKFAQTLRPRLTRKQVSAILRTNINFHQVMSQSHITTLASGTGSNLKTGNYRPIITNSLGNFHGDIGFFSINEHYPTPITYRSGYLVLVDVLSHLVYLEVLKKSKSADAVVAALENIFQRHSSKHDYPIISLGFDQERAIISRKVKSFLRQKNVVLKLFSFTSSKAKFAENTIERVRKIVDVLEKQNSYTKPWWKLLPDIEGMLNYRPIIIQHRVLSFTPAQITEKNLHKFIEELHAASPAFFFGQFNIDPALINFQFKMGDWVKAKTIVTSSAVIGEKRSTHHLTDETFVVVMRQAYIRRNLTIGKQYMVKEIHNDDQNLLHSFNEEDLSLYSETPWK